ncbi:MAG TPA: hypothetical protein VK914_05050 [bacterium]|jgi:hypothetical protein|nr:hypothetical protein [bacterium]
MNSSFDPGSNLKRRASGEEHAFLYWAWAGGLVFAALAVFEVLVLRPGLGAPEELANLAYIVHAGETWRVWVRIGGGAISRGIMALSLAGPWGWQAIYLFNVLALGGLAWGLWSLGSKLGGAKAAALSLAFAYCAPFSFLQARTTFSYVLVPALLLGLILALRQPCGRWASLALGAAAALAWLDYEAWILAVPALLAAWASAPRHARAKGTWVLTGVALGCLLLAWAEAPYMAEWLFQRGHGSSGQGDFLPNLKSFFFGGSSPLAMGMEEVPSFPILAWPGLLVGIIAAPIWLWVWAVGGLLGLAAAGPVMEPNRAILAWPALLLISALGTAWLWKRFAPRLSGIWLGIFLVAAPLTGYIQFNRAIAPWDADIHGPSRVVFQMADFLKKREAEHPVALGGSLDLLLHPLLERMLPSMSGPACSGCEVWFLVPRSMADPADPRWGRWVAFNAAGDAYPQYLLLASPRAEALLSQAAQDLAPEQGIMANPGPDRLAALRSLPDQAKNPWSWTAWSSLRLQSALELGQVKAGDVLPLLKGPCLSEEPLITISEALERTQPQATALARKRMEKLERVGTRWTLVFGIS